LVAQGVTRKLSSDQATEDIILSKLDEITTKLDEQANELKDIKDKQDEIIGT
jgi:hypothetical protein